MNKYLIVGLGNIGEQYINTRHNIGFNIIEVFAEKNNAQWRIDRLAYVTEFKIKGKAIFLIKPTTFMNLSGKALKYWMDKEKIALENVLVLLDDLALPIEKLRLRGDGSDAGHNGLKDIQFMLQSTKYARLKFGIGNNYPKGMQADFVLGKWKKEEVTIAVKKIDIAVNTIEKFILEGLTPAMNYCNSFIVE